ncbi:MAG TPA: hypothetical protein PLG90_01025 [Ignavibacteria bacterium]|nr:hypothetical protein [Ignavibacteria bacterium]
MRTEKIILENISDNEISKHSLSYVHLIISKFDNTYCSLCPEFNIAMEAENLTDLLEFSKEAIKDYIELCIESQIRIFRHSSIELIDEYKKNELEIIKITISKNILEYA